MLWRRLFRRCSAPLAKLSDSTNISKPAPPSGEHIPCSVRAACIISSFQPCRSLDCGRSWKNSASSCSNNRFSPIFMGSFEMRGIVSGDPHGTDPKFVRITEVFSLQFFGGTGGTGGTPRDLMLQRWYQPVGPVFANFVFMVVPPVSPISTTIISIMCLQYHRYHRYQPECVGALAGMSCNKRSRRDAPGDEVCRGPASIHRRAQRRPLDDLDAGAPGIRDVGDLVAGRGRLAWRLVQLDAVGLELLHEGGVILHVEADVIEDAMAGRRLGGIGLGEANMHARNAIHHRGIVAGARSATEGLGIPILRLRNIASRHEQGDVLVL